MDKTFRDRLCQGDILIGSFLTLPSPEIAEIFVNSGFEYLLLDLEHGLLDLKDAQRMVQTASPHTPCVIRVPSIDGIWIKKVLDIGPAGILLPMVNTADQAARAVQLCKYPPEGIRSVGVARAHGYGENFQSYVHSANQRTAVIIQVEHRDGVENIDSILGIPGIDCIFIGPYDLSASMGKTGQVNDPEVQQAIRRVENRVKQAELPLGIFCASEQAVMPFLERGYSLFAIGTDIMIMSGSAKKIIQGAKKIAANNL